MRLPRTRSPASSPGSWPPLSGRPPGDRPYHHRVSASCLCRRRHADSPAPQAAAAVRHCYPTDCSVHRPAAAAVAAAEGQARRGVRPDGRRPGRREAGWRAGRGPWGLGAAKAGRGGPFRSSSCGGRGRRGCHRQCRHRLRRRGGWSGGWRFGRTSLSGDWNTRTPWRVMGGQVGVLLFVWGWASFGWIEFFVLFKIGVLAAKRRRFGRTSAFEESECGSWRSRDVRGATQLETVTWVGG